MIVIAGSGCDEASIRLGTKRRVGFADTMHVIRQYQMADTDINVALQLVQLSPHMS